MICQFCFLQTIVLLVIFFSIAETKYDWGYIFIIHNPTCNFVSVIDIVLLIFSKFGNTAMFKLLNTLDMVHRRKFLVSGVQERLLSLNLKCGLFLMYSYLYNTFCFVLITLKMKICFHLDRITWNLRISLATWITITYAQLY